MIVKAFFLVIICLNLFMRLYAQENRIIDFREISARIQYENNNVILLGENSDGKMADQILVEYAEILNESNIDTIFLEMSYATYVDMIVVKSFAFRYNKLKVSNISTIVPIGIESDLNYALSSLELIYFENNPDVTKDSVFYDGNREKMFYSRETKNYEKTQLLAYLEKLKKQMTPHIKNYQTEFITLIDRMEKTYSALEPEELDMSNFSAKKDSLMASIISEYVQLHHLKKWGGVFESFHISRKEDQMYLKVNEVEQNMLNYFFKNQLINPSKLYRIMYDRQANLRKMPHEIKETFMRNYVEGIRKLKKHEVIIENRDNTCWIISR